MTNYDGNWTQESIEASIASGNQPEGGNNMDEPFSNLDGFIPVCYCPLGQSQTELQDTLIEATTDYDEALESAKTAFHESFPSGSANHRWWLMVRTQGSTNGWLKLKPEIFSKFVSKRQVELKLCEEADVQLEVSLLPIGHKPSAAQLESYLEFKIIIVGLSATGKSTMLQYLTTKAENRITLSPTIGTREEVVNRLETSNGELIQTHVWDTAGQERSRKALPNSFYRGAHGVFLLYSVIDPMSLRTCVDWLTDINYRVDCTPSIMLIGNQIDRSDERSVRESEGQAFASQHKLLFAEVSAIIGTNVEYAFRRLVHEIFNKLKAEGKLDQARKTKTPPETRTVTLDDSSSSSSSGGASGGCC